MRPKHTKSYRSGLEADQGLILDSQGAQYGYENLTIHYLDKPKKRTYKPDFIFKKFNGDYLIIETKGWWETEDRQKHVAIKEQYPDLDIRFVFTNPRNKIRKGSKTSYADFCDKHGWMYAAKRIPEEWLEECDLAEAAVVDELGLERSKDVLKRIQEMYQEGLYK
jgi:hypothetical protein